MNDFIINNCSNKLDNNLSHSILKNSKSYKFHTKQHYYNKTPLVQLNSLSNHLCLNNIHIKDESNRFDCKREKIMPIIVDYVMRNPKWKVSLQTHKYLNIP